MNKDQLIKEVSEKIIKVVPEIRELKFGCKLIENGKELIITSVKGNKIEVINEDIVNEVFSKNCWLSKMEIIGRPITLEDVLRALGYKAGDYRIYAEGFIRFFRLESLMFEWLLGQPLSNQSIETLMALNKIL